MGTLDGEVKTCKYTNPVPGGSFRLKHKPIVSFPFLKYFISIKPITATIISTLEDRLMSNPDFRIRVTPQAIIAELKNIEE